MLRMLGAIPPLIHISSGNAQGQLYISQLQSKQIQTQYAIL